MKVASRARFRGLFVLLPSSGSWNGLASENLCLSSPILRTCWLKLWLMKVASRARFRGLFVLLPSSCGGSELVSLTVKRSNSVFSRLSKKDLATNFVDNNIPGVDRSRARSFFDKRENTEFDLL